MDETKNDDAATMPLEDLKAKIEGFEVGTVEPPVTAQVTTDVTTDAVKETPQKTVEEGQSKTQTQEQESAVVEKDTTVSTQTDTKPEVGAPNLDGFKTVEDLSKSYKELRKKMTQQAQELAEKRKLEVSKSEPVVKTDYTKTEQDVWLERRIEEVGTVAALSELNALMNKPLFEKQKDTELESEIGRLRNSPDTADFNLPEIQKEIHKIIEERPRQFADNDGRIFPQALEDLYYMAKGRVSMVRRGITENTVTKKPAPVEGRSKVSGQAETFNPNTVSLEKLAEHIRRMEREQ